MPWEKGRGSRCSRSHPSDIPDLLQVWLERLLELPAPAVYAVVGVLAAVENVFPPVPADTAVAIGVFLSHAGQVSAGTVFLITWLTNAASAAAVYYTARVAGRPFFKGRIGSKLLAPAALARLEALYQRYGAWGIFVSRFVPGVRAVVPPFAGIAGVGSLRALVPTIVASGIWYGVLTVAVVAVAKRLDDVAALVSGMNRIGIGLFVAAVLLVGGLFWIRQKRRRADPGTSA